MSAVTAAVVPVVRVAVTVPLSTAPTGILSVVAPPSMLPFVTLTGSVIVNGAPAGTVALNPLFPTLSRETARTIGSTELSCTSRIPSAESPSNTPSGRLLNRLLGRLIQYSEDSPSNTSSGRLLSRFVSRLSSSSADRPSNTPAGRALNWISSRSRNHSADRPSNTSTGRVLN